MEIKINNEMFLINEQPIYLYGGEFHYFRLPVSEWEDRIIKIKEAGCNLVSTYIPWIFHESSEGECDLTGKTRPEKDLKRFVELIHKHGMYCCVRPGPYIMAETENEGVPWWIMNDYKDVIGKKRDGSQHRCVTYLHPTFLEKVKVWYKQVCDLLAPMQITQGGPIILFQLDNEIGMFHYVMRQPDFSEVVLEYFEAYLEQHYTLEELKVRYKSDYLNYYEFALNAVTLEQKEGHKFQHDYGTFLRDYHKEYVRVLRDFSREFGINVPFIVNIHGFTGYNIARRGLPYPTGVSQLYKTAELEDVYLAGDYYIGNVEFDNFHDLLMANLFTKAVQPKNQPLFSAEFQSGMLNDRFKIQPTSHEFNTRTCIAHGLKALNYYMFAGGENYEHIGHFGRRHEWQAPIGPDGDTRPHYFIYQRIGKMLQLIGKDLLNSVSKPDTTIAFNPDYYKVDTTNNGSANVINRMVGLRDKNLTDGIIKWMAQESYLIDSVNCLDDCLNPQDMPTLWMFSTDYLNKAIQEKCVEYIKNGGKLILFPSIPSYDIDGTPCTILKDYMGVQVLGQSGRDFLRISEFDSVLIDDVTYYQVRSEEIIATSEENFQTVSFKKKIDLGEVLVFGGSFGLGYRYLNEVYNYIASQMGISRKTLKSSDLEVVIREEKEARFVFIHNYDHYEQSTAIKYCGQTLFDGKTLSIPARTGVTYLVNYAFNDFYIDYATCEILEFNEDYLLVRVVEDVSIIQFKSNRQILEDEHVFVSGNQIFVKANASDLIRISFKK